MLAFNRYGEGSRQVVMLHGFLGSSKNFGLLIQMWLERDPTLSIIVPDLPGHGASPPLRAEAELKAVAEAILEFLDDAQVSKPYSVVGYSLGGRIALAARLIAPERFARIVLLDSTPAYLEGRRTELTDVLDAVLEAPDDVEDRSEIEQALIDRGVSHGLVLWLMMNVSRQGSRFRWKIDRHALADAFERSKGDEFWAGVETPGCSVDLIRGDESSFVREEDARRVQKAGGRVFVIEGAGHFLHVQKPTEVVAALQQLF